MIIIETERLSLKPISLDYAEDIFKEFTSEIAKYMFPKPFENFEEAYKSIEKSLIEVNEGKALEMVIIKKDNNEFIGCIGIYDLNKLEPGLWIWTKKSSHNNGFGIEAMTGLIEWIHKNIKFNYLVYPVDKRNIASRNIPEKNNGKIMKEEKSHGEAGNELDEYEYRIFPKNIN
jgi:RimJ/RimL family protein N-acetyltransferase